MPRKVVIAGVYSALICALFVLWMIRPKKTAVTVRNSAPAPVATPPDPLQQRIDGIVARYRKTIVLLEDDDSLPETDRENASLVGRIIFQENHQDISALSDELTSAILSASDWSRSPANLSHFLDLIETQSDLHDADKLVFRETFTDVAESLSGLKTSAAAKIELEHRVETDRQALAEIQSLYEKELDKIFGRFETRGMPVRREAWDRYVAYLHTKYRREDILKSYESTVKSIRLSAKAGHQDNDLETYGGKLPARTLLLTFDDGPILGTRTGSWRFFGSIRLSPYFSNLA
jgi:hypothetical protein